MTTLTKDLPGVLDTVRAAGTPLAALNPVYRALAADEVTGEGSGGTAGAGAGSALVGSELDLVVRHVTAPAILVLAVESDGSARRVRVGIRADGATVEGTEGSAEDSPGTSYWSQIALADVPRLLAEQLPSGSPLGAPPQLTVQGTGAVLRLEPTHVQQLRELLVAGVDAETAFSRIEGLDPRLRDALTARGDRASLSLTLHSPDRARLERPVGIARLWACGQLGIYRTDAPEKAQIEVVPVGPGDVLGTVVPLLDQAIRFASGLPPIPGDEDPAGARDEGARP